MGQLDPLPWDFGNGARKAQGQRDAFERNSGAVGSYLNLLSYKLGGPSAKRETACVLDILRAFCPSFSPSWALARPALGPLKHFCIFILKSPFIHNVRRRRLLLPASRELQLTRLSTARRLFLFLRPGRAFLPILAVYSSAVSTTRKPQPGPWNGASLVASSSQVLFLSTRGQFC